MNGKLDYQIHNCHAHVFTIDDIPRYFLSRFISPSILRWSYVRGIISWLSAFDRRYDAFLFAATKNQKDIFTELQSYYPLNTKFCLLSIDFDFMGAGKCKHNFLSQLQSLEQLANEINKPNNQVIHPFIGVDPRRRGILDLVKDYIENRGFTGIKLYPALGFFPDDPRLDEIYAFASRYEIPITTHCIPKNRNHFRGKITSDMYLKAKGLGVLFDQKEAINQYDFAQYLLHPHWYRCVLEKFPDLKINFGHFGGDTGWNKYLDNPHFDNTEDTSNWYRLVRNLLKDFRNTYADISFTVHDDKLYPLLKNVINSNYKKPGPPYSLTEKVLFGTDFYMLQKDYNERRFGIDVRGYLSDELYWQIAERNPKRFISTLIPS